VYREGTGLDEGIAQRCALSNLQSKCSTKRASVVCLKREGADAPRDETIVSIERNDEGRLKEGDAAELNTPLPLQARGDSFVAGAYSSSP
jgi:hypothetical protein